MFNIWRLCWFDQHGAEIHYAYGYLKIIFAFKPIFRLFVTDAWWVCCFKTCLQALENNWECFRSIILCFSEIDVLQMVLPSLLLVLLFFIFSISHSLFFSLLNMPFPSVSRTELCVQMVCKNDLICIFLCLSLFFAA